MHFLAAAPTSYYRKRPRKKSLGKGTTSVVQLSSRKNAGFSPCGTLSEIPPQTPAQPWKSGASAPRELRSKEPAFLSSTTDRGCPIFGVLCQRWDCTDRRRFRLRRTAARKSSAPQSLHLSRAARDQAEFRNLPNSPLIPPARQSKETVVLRKAAGSHRACHDCCDTHCTPVLCSRLCMMHVQRRCVSVDKYDSA
jgi:hypothetical protein